jgi:hypothetical protein
MNLPEHSSEKSGFAVVLELDSGTVLYGHFEARDYELEFLHSPDKADIHPTRERAQEDIDCFHKDDGSGTPQVVQIKKTVNVLLWND